MNIDRTINPRYWEAVDKACADVLYWSDEKKRVAGTNLPTTMHTVPGRKGSIVQKYLLPGLRLSEQQLERAKIEGIKREVRSDAQVEIDRLRVRVEALERRLEVLIGLSPEATKLLRSDPEHPWFE